MEVNQVQIFEKGYNNRCSTFACGNRALRYIGRPDAPLNLSYVLCEKCLNELVQSVNEQYLQVPQAPDDVMEIVNNMNADPEYRQNIMDNEEIRAWFLHALDLEKILKNKQYYDKEPVDDVVTAEMVNDARTHAELDQLVAKYNLINIPTKADGATLDERKQVIIDSIN